ncbi:MAG: Diadenosine tetraphosphate (Ap4A) hydrolase [Chloroflexi bacterium]|nr:MAG: Diadenosine tetraphosphate (Ap4A) hydrolase [Chloroflexota bacterium]
MSHSNSDPDCQICEANASGSSLFENDLWVVGPMSLGVAVPGWMVMRSRRHVGGPAHFNDAEAANFGPALRHLERTLEEVTGALRIYTAAWGESVAHFHAHLIPRYESMPVDGKPWALFDRIGAEETAGSEAAEVSRVAEAYGSRLRAEPPPR